MRVLIVGAGFVGLSLARQLASRGYDLRVIEKGAEGRAQEGSGICLPAQAVARMADLGLKEALLGRAHRVRQVQMRRPDGTLLSSASLDQPPLDEQPFVALPRAELVSLLKENLNQKINYQTWVDSLDERGQVVRVRDNHGHEGDYDLVVGADGMFSAVRNMIFPGSRLIDFGLTSWRFLWPCPQHGMQPTYIAGANDLFMFYPVSPDLLYCYAHASAQKDDAKRRRERLRQQFASYSGQVRAAIDATDEQQLVLGRILSVTPPCKAYHGRVVLVGDAMHGCPPSMQSGLDLGLEDVLVLGHCLPKAGRGADVPAALQMFAQAREERVSWVVTRSNKMIKLAQLGRFPWGRWLRNRIIRRKGPPNVLAWRQVLSRGFSLPAAAPQSAEQETVS